MSMARTWTCVSTIPYRSRWTATGVVGDSDASLSCGRHGYRAYMTHMLLNRLTAKPGQRDLVVQNLLESGRLFDNNAACLLYLVTERADSPNDIWVVDLWTTEEEHTTALQAPEMQPYIAETLPLLEGMPEQIEVQARGGKEASNGDASAIAE